MKKQNYFSLLLIWSVLVTNSFGQFFSETNYVGAMGETNWAKSWTDFTPIDNEYPEPKVTLSGVISKNTVISNANTYLLSAPLYVTNNATLYIEKGTVIRAEQAGAIIIARGAKIKAIGTKEEPIIFTSSKLAGKRERGDWCGISILGKAKINLPGGVAHMEGMFDATFTEYGGTKDDDCSGILSYVRIEFAGKKYSKENELNGLSLYGVGSRTKMDNIQVSYSGDDGFQFFGGTVSAKYIVSFQSADDCYEFSSGYRGKIQHGIALRHYNLGDADGSRAIEAETYFEEKGAHYDLLTHPVLSNFTIVSPEAFFAQSSTGNIKEAINVELGASLSLYNSLIIGFPTGLKFSGESVAMNIDEKKIQIRNNLLVGCSKPVAAEKTTYDINSWFVTPEFKNIFRPKADIGKVFKNQFSIYNPDFTERADLVVKPDFIDLFKGEVKEEEFFEVVPFRGAFGEEDWSVGWSEFDPGNKSYATPTVKVTGVISGNVTWSDHQTYLLQGVVTVKSGSKLTINPGTVILGESASRATLVVEPGAIIYAEGDINHPIVFTSDKAVGSKKYGDWGGVVILGNGKVVPSKEPVSIKEIFSWLPDVRFGNKKGSAESGAMKYVRVEYAGAAPDKTKESAGLVLAGVEAMQMENVQVSYSGGDGLFAMGGNVSLEKVILLNNMDDDLVSIMGYAGKIQYALIWRDPILASPNGAYGLVIGGCTNSEECEVVEQPEFSNFSIIGPNRRDVLHYNQNFKAAVLLNTNASFALNNSILASFPTAITMRGEETHFHAYSQQMQFKNNIIANCGQHLNSDEKDPFFINKWFTKESNRTTILNNYDELKLEGLPHLYVTMIPGTNSPCLNSKFECLGDPMEELE